MNHHPVHPHAALRCSLTIVLAAAAGVWLGLTGTAGARGIVPAQATSSPTPAICPTCPQPLPPPEAMRAADAVFVGTVLTDTERPGGGDVHVLQFHVSTTWTNRTVAERTTVEMPYAVWVECGRHVAVGQAWIVYADEDADHRLVIPPCSRSHALVPNDPDPNAMDTGCDPVQGMSLAGARSDLRVGDVFTMTLDTRGFSLMDYEAHMYPAGILESLAPCQPRCQGSLLPLRVLATGKVTIGVDAFGEYRTCDHGGGAWNWGYPWAWATLTIRPSDCPSCPAPPSPQEALSAADAAFVGTATAVTHRPERGGHEVLFHVSTTWTSGAAGEWTTVTVPDADWDCGRQVAEGQEWLIYARRDQDSRLVIGSCDRSHELAEHDPDLAALGGRGCDPVGGIEVRLSPPSVHVGEAFTMTIATRNLITEDFSLRHEPQGLVRPGYECSPRCRGYMQTFVALAPGTVTITVDAAGEIIACVHGPPHFAGWSSASDSTTMLVEPRPVVPRLWLPWAGRDPVLVTAVRTGLIWSQVAAPRTKQPQPASKTLPYGSTTRL